MITFTGAGAPLSQTGFAGALTIVAIPPPALWAVLSVETSGCGYLIDRRPKILFERHVFHRLTNGQYDADDPDVSAPTQGGYGLGGANQYVRLQSAMQLDAEAALQSASWGLGQIMGENYAAAGFASVDAMVQAFVASEDAQLGGMVHFIKANGMDTSLTALDWANFARRYNGPNYAANNYDGLLAKFYQQFETGAPPDLTVRAVQTYLYYHGATISIDGIMGPSTRAAIIAFQTTNGLPATGAIDNALLQALSS